MLTAISNKKAGKNQISDLPVHFLSFHFFNMANNKRKNSRATPQMTKNRSRGKVFIVAPAISNSMITNGATNAVAHINGNDREVSKNLFMKKGYE